MANPTSVADYFRSDLNSPVSVPAVVGATAIAAGTATPWTNAAGQNVQLTMPNPAVALGGEEYPLRVLTNKPFVLKAAGLITGGTTSGTALVAIYLGSTGGSSIMSTGAVSFNTSVAANWGLIAEPMFWDSVSTNISGVYSGWLNNTVKASTVITPQTAATFPTSLVFIPQFIFGTANANNSIQITELSLDLY